MTNDERMTKSEVRRKLNARTRALCFDKRLFGICHSDFFRHWVFRYSSLLVACLAILGTAVSTARHCAAEDTAGLKNRFQNPPAEYRPLVFTHKSGQANLDWVEEIHAGGNMIYAHPTPGSHSENEQGERPVNATYMNDPEEFRKVRETAEALHERGDVFWIYDELRYPSPSAGGHVVDGNPEYAVESIGATLIEAGPGKTATLTATRTKEFTVYAYPLREGQLILDEAIALTDDFQDGNYRWRAPNGEAWTVCLLERFFPDTWKRHNMRRRIVNIMNRKAIQKFLRVTHDRYAEEFGDLIGEAEMFFTDEPQLASVEHWASGQPEQVPMVQWCDELPGTFKDKKGYTLTPSVLAALFHPAGAKTSKYRFDFYDVLSDLVAENYFGQIQQWCHEHGTSSGGHQLLEESLLFHVMFSGSAIKNWSRMDYPGIDSIHIPAFRAFCGWERKRFTVREDFVCKMASSVAHLQNKHGVPSEAYGGCSPRRGYDEKNKADLTNAKAQAVWEYASGVTHMNPFWLQRILTVEQNVEFNTFVGRMAVLTRRGRHVAEIAVLVPEYAVWAGYNPPGGGRYETYFDCNPEAIEIDRQFRRTCHLLSKNQRDFDCLSENFLLESEVKEGRLYLADESFSTLVMPEPRMLSWKALEKIAELLRTGGQVVLVGQSPSHSTERGADAKITKQFDELFEKHPRQTWRVADVLEKDEKKFVDRMTRDVTPDALWKGSDTIRLLHRQEDARDIVMLANGSPKKDARGMLAVPAQGQASLWDPETGKIDLLGPCEKGHRFTVDVPKGSARFLVVE